MEEQSSKLSVKQIVLIVLAVAAIVACLAAAILKSGVFASPKATVEAALCSLLENGEESSLEGVFGIKELQGRVKEQGAGLTAEVLLTEIDGGLFGLSGLTIPNAGILAAVQSDAKNGKHSMDLVLKAADTKLASLTVYLDKEQMQLAVPEFFTPVLSLPCGDPDLFWKLKGSYLGQMLGLEEEYWEMLEAGILNGQDREAAEASKQFAEGISKLQKKLYAGMEAKKNGTVTVSTAGDVTCKSYTALFPEQLVEEVLEEGFALVMDYFEAAWRQPGAEEGIEGVGADGMAAVPTFASFAADAREMLEQLKEELHDVTLLLDMKGDRVVRLTLLAECETEGTFTYEVLFALEGSYWDNMVAALTKQGEAEPLFLMSHTTRDDKAKLSTEWEVSAKEAKFLLEGDYNKASGDFLVTVTADDGIAVSLEGVVTELKKGEAIAAELNKLSVTEGGVTETAGFEFAFSYRVFAEELAPISQNAQNMLDMKEDDWNSLIMEVYGKLFGLLGSLGGLFY